MHTRGECDTVCRWWAVSADASRIGSRRTRSSGAASADPPRRRVPGSMWNRTTWAATTDAPRRRAHMRSCLCGHIVDVDSDSDVTPTELDASSDEDIGVLPVAARVTWAVPEFVIIFIASVGKGKRLPDRERVMRGRGALQDIPPPGEDSEDDDSDDDQGYSETAAEQWLRQQGEQ